MTLKMTRIHADTVTAIQDAVKVLSAFAGRSFGIIMFINHETERNVKTGGCTTQVLK